MFFNPLSKKERKLLKQLKKCEITDGVYRYYRNYVRGRKNEEYNNVRKLLIRNIILSKEANKNKFQSHRRLFYYGNLSIIYNKKENSIVWINNVHNKETTFYPNARKKKWLNRKLKIAS